MPHDFGPIYIETNFNRFPVEPFNSASNLVFLLILIFWANKIKFDYKYHRMLALSLPILLVGYIGGTLYHATRASNIWLLMDFIPIIVLCLLFAFHYWKKILRRSWKVWAFVFLPFIFLRLILIRLLETKNMAITAGYALLAIILLIPIFLYAFRRKITGRYYLVSAAILFLIALMFRWLDSPQSPQIIAYFPMGTHWLWHICGGIAIHLTICFVHKDNALQQKNYPPDKKILSKSKYAMKTS